MLRVAVLLLIAIVSWAAEPSKGVTERVLVHGRSLEGNLIGDSSIRDVSVYLPPSYARSPQRRYPVVFMLHGFTDSDDQWFGLRKHWINLPEVLDGAIAGGAAEMIVVMPNALNVFGGSGYSSSVTTGDWETFIARELVAYIDSHYRTLPTRGSRGLAGHSFGGYGALRIAMKFPDVFSSVYALSSCCLLPPGGGRAGSGRAEQIQSLAEIAAADFGTKAQLASAAAWSPNPQNPPLFLDLPTKNGESQPLVLARWAANAPVAMFDQYIPHLRQLNGIALDCGDADGLLAGSREYSRQLNNYGIAHDFAVYPGNHINGVASRIEKQVMPFFSGKLAFQ
ncbi:MAG: alpha/beta fold hydrolase [Bryobacterales bacterium]|nr:alpha/beta fold hydrolase [Bryobacterales bacterium]